MNTRLKYALAVGLILLAAGAAGCGSSDDGEAEAKASALPKAIYVEKGDRICEDNYAKRTQLIEGLSQSWEKLPPLEKQEEILVKQIMPIFWEESKELNALPPPQEGAEEAKKILASLEESIRDVEANPAKTVRKGSVVEFGDTEKLARAYGFESCGGS
jgi:hypothetical protein